MYTGRQCIHILLPSCRPFQSLTRLHNARGAALFLRVRSRCILRSGWGVDSGLVVGSIGSSANLLSARNRIRSLKVSGGTLLRWRLVLRPAISRGSCAIQWKRRHRFRNRSTEAELLEHVRTIHAGRARRKGTRMERSIEQRVTENQIAYEYVTSMSEDARSNPWIVMCHGTGVNRILWRRWYPHLAARFSLCAVDIPGYGESPRAIRGAYYGGVASWWGYLLTVLDHIKAESVFLVGEQSGGLAGIHLGMEATDRIRGLMTISTPLHGSAVASAVSSHTKVAEREGIRNWSNFMSPLLASRCRDDRVLADVREMQLACSVETIVEDGRSWRGVDLRESIGAMSIPYLALVPGSSEILERSHWLDLEASLADQSELILVGGGDQLMSMTRADLCASIAKAFFSGLVEAS